MEAFVFILCMIVPFLFYYCVISLIKQMGEKISYAAGKTSGNIEKKINNLSEVEFVKNKGYYRKILEINSPIILGFLDNLKLDKNKLIAHLLYMKEKEIIIIEDGKIRRNKANINVELSDIEAQILSQIKNEGFVIKDINSFMEKLEPHVKKEAQKQELIKIKNIHPKIKKILKKIAHINMWISAGLMGLGFFLAYIYIVFELHSKLSSILDIIYTIIDLVLIFWPLLCYYLKSWASGYSRGRGENDCKRTQKGIELNEKMEGLKNYIKDFSLLSERESKEIELWEDYLIYSVMFGQNKKIIKEYEEYIEIKK